MRSTAKQPADSKRHRCLRRPGGSLGERPVAGTVSHLLTPLNTRGLDKGLRIFYRWRQNGPTTSRPPPALACDWRKGAHRG
jgi:hypothetical protein